VISRAFGRLLGRRIRRWRAGDQWRVGADIRFSQVPRTVALGSPAFDDGAPLPRSTTSPPLTWSGVPSQTKRIVLIVEDVDVPMLRPLTHAIAYAIDPAATELAEGALDGAHEAMGFNGAGRRGWLPPSPPPGHGPHRYVFTLLAVDFVPRFDQPPTRGRLLDAIAGHVAALAEIVGTAER